LFYDKVDVAIKRLKAFERKMDIGLLSWGKGQCCYKELANMAGVKYEAHYCLSTVDPPELVRFIKDFHGDV
jgi:phosphoadenosine phosphosulfate reductase